MTQKIVDRLAVQHPRPIELNPESYFWVDLARWRTSPRTGCGQPGENLFLLSVDAISGPLGGQTGNSPAAGDIVARIRAEGAKDQGYYGGLHVLRNLEARRPKDHAIHRRDRRLCPYGKGDFKNPKRSYLRSSLPEDPDHQGRSTWLPKG